MKTMAKTLALLLVTVLTTACGNGGNGGGTGETGNAGSKADSTVSVIKAVKARKPGRKAKKKSVLTPGATGSPYEILVVANPEDFQTGAYDSLFAVLTDEIPGLPQAEPQFRVSKVSTSNYSKTLKYCRNIIELKINPERYTKCRIKYSQDVYSVPQFIMTIQAPDARSFCDFVADSHDVIIDFFNRAELQREATKLMGDCNPNIRKMVMKKFGCEVSVPCELGKIKTGRNFLWAATDKGENDMNFVIYSYPYTDPETFTEEYCLKMRDSVMKANIPGPLDGMYMQTSRPFVKVYDSSVHGEYAQFARGLWDISNYDMGGPFVSISRVDEKNGRVVVVEGFVFAPNGIKRKLIRRMEASLYTLFLPDELDLRNNQFEIEEITIKPE